MAEPFSIVAGSLAVAGYAGKATQAARDFHRDYHDAERQIRHARLQYETLQANLASCSSSCNPLITATQLSLEAIEEEFPKDIRADSKRARIRWAAKQKLKVDEGLDQLKNTGISGTLALQWEQLNALSDIQVMVSEIQDKLTSKAEELQRRGLEHQTSKPQPYNQNADTRLSQWRTSISEYLGIKSYLIVSQVDGKNKYNVHVRWPLLQSIVLNGRIATSWSSWPDLSFQPRFRVQNIIPRDSPIIDACQNGNVVLTKELFLAGLNHPNDTTEDNLTLLYFAIQNGKLAIVQFLLKSGADPNLCYGQWDTSPLNTAFYYGHADIARSLLESKAELEYVNRRLWTSARYLFDPDLSNLHTTELLDICAAQGFDQWNAQDVPGWTIFHRAAAFGRDKDIKKLLNIKASTDVYIPALLWLPIHCAVRFGNESTFAVLVDLIPRRELLHMKDSRGWTLLHLAVANGSVPLISELLRRGLDPLDKTDQSDLAMPKDLKLRELTTLDIARSCGNLDTYKPVLEAASRVVEVELEKENGLLSG